MNTGYLNMQIVWLTILLGNCAVPSEGAYQFIAEKQNEDNDRLVQDGTTTLHREKREVMLPDPNIVSYHIVSTITARYVSTSVVAELINDANISQEVQFRFKLTPEAFISEFIMTVDDVPYVARVREKQVAQKAYNEARRRGQSAAQVRQSNKSSSDFSVDLNLEAMSTVIFNLTYQELLRRDKSIFKHAINVAPGQVVDDLRIEVNIIEPQGLDSVDASWNPDDNMIVPSISYFPPSTAASVVFSPSAELQSRSSNVKGLDGVLEVTYDVVHELNGGDLQIVNGYFVHHISPEGIPPAPKKVIFVIDVSGSMSGTKMAQTIDAMVTILGQLRDIDQFNVLSFETTVRFWRQHVVRATPKNVIAAQKFVTRLSADGGTNIHDPLVEAARQFHDTDDAFPAIVFLTDGQPNSGITGTDDIINAVSNVTDQRIALFSIGFGNDVDDVLLGRLSAENHGLYRKVYTDSSAAIQMQGFFDEVATPLLYNINIHYENDAVDPTTLTGGNFISYFDGKELVVAGKVVDDYEGNSLDVLVTAKGRDKDVELRVSEEIHQVIDPNMVEDFAQRMWAYLTIKDLLAKEKLSTSATEKTDLKEKALELSLRYSFVTPMTSLLVIKPDNNVPTLPSATLPPATTFRPPSFTVRTGQALPILFALQSGYAPSIQSAMQSGQASPILSAHSTSTHSTSLGSRKRPAFQSAVGADPQFVISIPRTNLTICFDIQPDPGTFINLIDDPLLGIYINAKIVPVHKTPPTSLLQQSADGRVHHPGSFLGSFGVELGHHSILITPDRILIDFEIGMEWGVPRSIRINDYVITVVHKRNLTITVGDAISITIVSHNHPQANHSPHFDLSIENGDGFSKDVHGLLGQFQYKHVMLKNPNSGVTNGHVQGIMAVDGEDRHVFKTNKMVITKHDCWFSKPENYIDGKETIYFVSGYFSHMKDFSS